MSELQNIKKYQSSSCLAFTSGRNLSWHQPNVWTIEDRTGTHDCRWHLFSFWCRMFYAC